MERGALSLLRHRRKRNPAPCCPRPPARWLVCRSLFGSILSPCAPTNQATSLPSAPRGLPEISLFGASLLSLCLIDITLIACRYAVLSIREKQRLHSLFSLMPNPASPRPPSLRSHGVVLFGSLLSPLRPPPSALAPAAPSGGSPKLLFLAIPCLLFACLILPLLIADMRS